MTETRDSELKETVRGSDEPGDYEPRVEVGVAGDVFSDRLDVGDRARRPDEPAHAPKRRFTSS